jgi:hypothetical protein
VQNYPVLGREGDLEIERERERERELFNEFMVDYATVNLRDFSY